MAAAATGLVGTVGAGAAGSWNDAGAWEMSVVCPIQIIRQMDLRCPKTSRSAPSQL